MRILLIQPKMGKRPMDTDLKTRMSPPLGLFTLVALTPPQHDIVVVNENIDAIPWDDDADLVGITITLDVFPSARDIAERFRRRGVPVVAGGIHVTSCPDDCSPHFDAICIGPAERVWARIVADAQAHRLQRVYQDFDAFRGEEIVSPAYDRIDPRKYLWTNVVTTSRGCPLRCDFCYNSCQNRLYARRPIDDVIHDIESLNTKHVYFVDDNFIGNPRYTRELLTRLRGAGLKWNAAVTTHILNDLDLLDLMADTGCQSLFIGFESVNNAALAGVHKHHHAELYDRVVDELHRRGIMVNASMVFGLDGDGPAVFANTLDWLVKQRVETLTAHILTPYPGTQLHERMDAAGRIVDRDLSHYNTAHVVYRPEQIAAKDLYHGYLRIYRQFYSLKNIWRRRPLDARQTMPYFLFNLLYRKYGRLTVAVSRIVPLHLLGRLAERLAYRV